MLDGKKPENDCSIYLKHSNVLDVLDVNADHLTESISQTSLSDDIHNFEAKKETVTKQQSNNTSHSEQKQTESTFTEKDAKPHSSKRQHKLQHNIKHCQKKTQISQ